MYNTGQSVFEHACAELRNGQKTEHWMWFIFPQLAGLGFSDMARRFAIASLEEAQAYLDHPFLGPRLRLCTQLVNTLSDRPINQILGSIDGLKFRSCMTLFACATPDNELFRRALEKFCGGQADQSTLRMLGLADRFGLPPSEGKA